MAGRETVTRSKGRTRSLMKMMNVHSKTIERAMKKNLFGFARDPDFELEVRPTSRGSYELLLP